MLTDRYKSWRERGERTWRFMREDVWDIDLGPLSIRRRFGINALRVILLVLRGYRDDECPLHAAALTFTTMMSIVPILALSLALARGLGGEEAAKTWIRNRVADWTQNFEKAETLMAPAGGDAGAPAPAGEPRPAVAPAGGGSPADELDAAALARRINDMVENGFRKMENVSFGALGGVGLALLVWMVIAVLGQVESSFNQVWGVTAPRRLWRKFTDYLTILFILPLLMLLASSLPLADFATRYLDPLSASVVRDVLGSGLLKHLTVIAMTALAFMFLIMFMPNTRVKLSAGLTGGLVTGFAFLIWLWICAALQVGASKAGRLYGSFATLPILLAWVNVSWQIVFLGAEVAFAVQNCATYRMEQGSARASMRARLLLALSIVTETARSMATDGKPFQAGAFVRERRIPVRLLLGTLDELVKAGLMAELKDASGSYALLRAPDTLLARDVLQRLMLSGVNPGALGLGRVPDAVVAALEKSWKGVDNALAEMTVRDLVKAP